MYSYGATWLTYSLLVAALAIAWRNRALGLSVLICVSMTAVWGAVVSLGTLTEQVPVKLIHSAEAARNVAWMVLLHAIYGRRLQGTNSILAYRRWLPWYAAGITLLLIHLYALHWIIESLGLPASIEYDLNYVMWIGFALAFLVLLEQIYRLSNQTERWALKYLCLGLGFIALYDFLMYAEALILRQLDSVLWQARGAVVAFTAPLIAIAVTRSPKYTSEVQVSRNVVFHTLSLLTASMYLLYMAAVGYTINFLGGTWGGVFQITFLSISGLTFIVLAASARVRDMVRVWLSKYFFSYRYDYRREWLDFTGTLAESDGTTPRAVTVAMAKLCGSPSGLLWIRSEPGGFALADYWQIEDPGWLGDLAPLGQWLEKHEWIIDFQELKKSPEYYGGLDMPKGLAEFPSAWLVVPLMFSEHLEGILLLNQPEVIPDMNWEDRDLLKIAGRAAATHLAQYQAQNTLVELRQFEAFNRLSAYVVHDLKNILAQQSLIVTYADRYRNNPDFLDDVFETISNSVERMNRLMNQMRKGVRGSEEDHLDIVDLLRKVVKNRRDTNPRPALETADREYIVKADREQLATVFGHLIQNAQEATPDNGLITVRVQSLTEKIMIEIEDSGVGMSKEFIQQRLFKPFDTTKGLTGMGIGVVESREYVRSLGGELFVRSEPGRGTCFCIVLPCIKDRNKQTTEAGEVTSGE